MSMSVGGSSEEGRVMSEINTTPLVDVMLVLLIIFLITIPVITKSVPIALPKAVNIPTVTKPENITIGVDAKGNVYWNQALVPSQQSLLDHIKAAAVVKPQPEIHIRADKDVRYESVGRVIYNLQRGSIRKVGFITEPDRGVKVAR
jgi:biopolymer transport protein ExbD